MRASFFVKTMVIALTGFVLSSASVTAALPTDGIDRVLSSENKKKGVTLKPTEAVDELTYLRRVMLDVVGQIPTQADISEYLSWSSRTRQSQLVDKLLKDPRFADRWTVFFGDMLRLRSRAEAGGPLVAYVHQALDTGVPYDELCRRLIATNGKAGLTPEIGFVLGDDADPKALTGIVSQIFLGVRISCAECHDHPFDVWTQKDFYGLAAYFGKTRRIERRFKNRILSTYTMEVAQTVILWPPEGDAEEKDRKPMKPRFPFPLAKAGPELAYVARLANLRNKQSKPSHKKGGGPSIDDLLADASETAKKQTRGTLGGLGVVDEAKKAGAKLNANSNRYADSPLRAELANLITDPRNRYFSRCITNRVWKELIGRGFVEPVDDFTAENTPSHPQTLDFLSDEFVANGYDLRTLIRAIVTSDVYQRKHAENVGEDTRVELETAFLATPMRRMMSEFLFDSIVVAGHVFDVKHEAGKNLKVVWRESRIMKQPSRTQGAEVKPVALTTAGTQKKKMAAKKPKAPEAGYDLEKVIELDFKALLAAKDRGDEVVVDKMRVMSAEELEAMRMAQESQRRNAEYIDRYVKAIIDDNPIYGSSMRMITPAPPGHFVRVFGQRSRAVLGMERLHNPTMRQALMMLNGKLIYEASRVGEFEPVYPLLVGRKANLTKAIQLVYREILTREPAADEIVSAKEVINSSENTLDGMADFRWVLLNSNEFRFVR